jgi:AcrR family transcriptional regulator
MQIELDRERAQPRGTALALILAGERLIAEHGSAIVSMRQITEAANVSNRSAINYHFGSRDALMLAVFQYRMGGINDRRRRYLDHLAANDRLLDRRGLVEAMVHPLSEQLAPRPEGNHYVRFLERITREGEPVALSEMQPLMTAWVELQRRLRRSIGWLPAPVIDARIRMMSEQAVSGLASIEMMLERGAIARSALALEIEMLIDGIANMLAGPLSADTLRLLIGDAGEI